MPTPGYYLIQKAMQSPSVRRKLEEVRDQKFAQAQVIARAEGVTSPLVLSEGTRPKGRPYARLGIRAVDEFGDSRTKRSRILGRVARS